MKLRDFRPQACADGYSRGMRESDEVDPSGSTAQFRAFVDKSAGPDTTQTWAVHAPRNRAARNVAIAVGVVVVAVVGAILFIH